MSSIQVAGRCGMEALENIHRRRLRWFGHVKRRDEGDPLRRVGELIMEGRRPPGRPKKTWKKTIEDMRVVGAREQDAMGRVLWRGIIKRSTHA